MKIQIASDLHLDLLGDTLQGEMLIEPAPDADMLVLAGDISSGTTAAEVFAQWSVPVIYVAGNHEFYGASWEKTRADLRKECRHKGIYFLDNDCLEIGSVRVLGATLWSDFRVRGYTQRKVMEEVELGLNDYYRIHTQSGTLRAIQTLEDHEMTRRWLQRELARPFNGKTVVVTHHAPHERSIHPRYAGQALNGGFTSNLEELVERADLWIHGHTHDSSDYQFGRCRVISNPAGYTRNGRRANSASEIEFENGAFDPALVIEV